MPLALGLSSNINARLVPGPVAGVLAQRHAEQAELLVGADAAHQPVVHAADHGERFASGHVQFVHGDLDDGAVCCRGEDAGVRLKVFPTGGV
jgi:hypothetical protein